MDNYKLPAAPEVMETPNTYSSCCKYPNCNLIGFLLQYGRTCCQGDAL